MSGLKGLIDRLVEFLVGTCSLSRVEIASTSDATIGSSEVEGRRDGIEIAER
jgi:hypothetical protein